MAALHDSIQGRVRSTGGSVWRMQTAEHAEAQEDTPLGPLTKTMEVPQEDGKPRAWIDYVCPIAFLWKLASLSASFFRIMETLPQDEGADPPQRAARIALYLDDVTPGNVRRPDDARSYVAVYWTLLDLPNWLLHSTLGWFTLAFVPKKVWKLIPGQQSTLMQKLLQAFWPDEGPSFSAGVVLTHQAAALRLVADKVTLWLLDGDAVPKLTLSKTMSAFKCCCKCKNVVARISAEAVPAGPVTCEEPANKLL